VCVAASVRGDLITAARVRETGCLPLLVTLLSAPEAPGCEAACRALAELAADCELSRDCIRDAGALPSLVLLLSAGPSHPVTAAAAGALRNLARNNQANRDALREAGGIGPLISLLSGEAEGAATAHAAAAITNMAFPFSVVQLTPPFSLALVPGCRRGRACALARTGRAAAHLPIEPRRT